MSGVKETLNTHFNSIPREKRNQFFFNLVLGLIGLLICVGLENTNWGQSGINSWFDTFIAQKTKWQGRQATNPGLIILEIDDKAWLSMNKPALHIATELVLIVLTSLVFASFKPRLANILLLLLFNVCWILDFIYFYFSNEFINLNFSFMGIVIYKYLRQMETVFGALGKMKKKTDT